MRQKSVTFQINLDLRAVALLSVALLLLGLLIATTTAEAVPRSGPQIAPTPGLDADMVDSHLAGPSGGTKSQRANRVLWAQSNGTLSTKALPMAQLDNRYLNDDRNETINGNIQQSRANYGLVKAAVYVKPDGTCVRSFNPYGTTTCSRSGVGIYVIDFNFRVNDRYVTVTPAGESIVTASVYLGWPLPVDTIVVYIRHSSTDTMEDSYCMVIVF